MNFKIGNQEIKLKIKDKEIFYSDRMNSEKKLNSLLTESEMKEYNQCKTDEDLAEVCIKDIKEKGGKLISISKNESG